LIACCIFFFWVHRAVTSSESLPSLIRSIFLDITSPFVLYLGQDVPLVPR
jgi:hypothetical protein